MFHLLKELLPAIRSIADEVYLSCFVVRNVNSLLPTCGRPTVRTLSQLITAFGEWCRNESRTRQYITWQICDRRWWAPRLSVVDEAIDQWQKDSMPMFVQKEVTLNSRYGI